MTDKEKVRLTNRIATCQNEVELASRRLKLDSQDLKFWKNELLAAEAEFHGFKQAELNLNCATCGG